MPTPTPRPSEALYDHLAKSNADRHSLAQRQTWVIQDWTRPTVSSGIYVRQFASAAGDSASKYVNAITLGASPVASNYLVMGVNNYGGLTSPSPTGWTVLGESCGDNFYWFGRLVESGDGLTWGPYTYFTGPYSAEGGIAGGIWELVNQSASPLGYPWGNFTVYPPEYTVGIELGSYGATVEAGDLPLVMALSTAYASGVPPSPITLTRADSLPVTPRGTQESPTAPYPGIFAFGDSDTLPASSSAIFTATVPSSPPVLQTEISVCTFHAGA